MSLEQNESPEISNAVPGHVSHNIESIAALRSRAEENIGSHQRVIERVTASLGRPRTIYFVLGFVLLWAILNARHTLWGHDALDPPPYYWLQGLIGLSALLMTTMVLTTQNRQAKHAEQRDHLDLQINLLSEQKIAKLVALLEELRRDLPVRDRVDLVAEAMTEAVNPHAVASALETSLEEATHEAREVVKE